MSVSLTEVDKIINELNLSPHPEGGYFREIYRADEKVTTSDEKKRSASTGIYFLLPAEVCTNWHRVSSDELWHFYLGDELMLEIIDKNGAFHQQTLHNDILNNANLQELVPKNCWQRAYSTGTYSLVGCTVSPGFEFDDFEMMEPDDLASHFPDVKPKIMHGPFA